jgi:hypothetical protein
VTICFATAGAWKRNARVRRMIMAFRGRPAHHLFCKSFLSRRPCSEDSGLTPAPRDGQADRRFPSIWLYLSFFGEQESAACRNDRKHRRTSETSIRRASLPQHSGKRLQLGSGVYNIFVLKCVRGLGRQWLGFKLKRCRLA